MRRSYLIGAVILVLSGLILVYSQSTRRTTQTPQTRATAEPITIEKVVSTQQRINRYFHGDVMSKLEKCWSSVRGKGKISLKYTYTKAGARWLFNRLETDQSTLPSGQETIAMKCMAEAVRGTSFAVDGTETPENSFVLIWTWPVPLPANANQLTTAMFAARAGESPDGGCDGWGTPPRCYTCGIHVPGIFKCDKVCVGSSSCSTDSDGLGCATQKDNCASGGPFSVSGRPIMF